MGMRGNHYLLALCAVGILACGFGGQGGPFQRERDGKTDALKNAVEGKVPPKLTATAWMNSAPLTWKELKGKVVLLDFWAYW